MARKGKLKERSKEDIERPVRIHRYEYLFLIVCEDQKTEKQYFDSFQPVFPPKTVYLRTIGAGLDPKGVVERSVLERDNLAAEAGKEVDVVWAVFDKDDADLNAARRLRFDEAWNTAGTEKIKLAFSNEVFELWLLLQLTNVSGSNPLPRQTIYTMLEAAIRNNAKYAAFTYEHGNTDVLEIIAAIGDETAAIQRAESLLAAHAGKTPIERNPSTTVHCLIKELHEWIAYYTFAS